MRVPVCETESKTEIVGRVGMAATFVALLFCFFFFYGLKQTVLHSQPGSRSDSRRSLTLRDDLCYDVRCSSLSSFLKPSSPARGRQARV